MTKKYKKRNDIILSEEFKDKLMKLYPNVNKIYPYLNKKSNRVTLSLIDERKHVKTTLLSRATLEVKLGRKLEKDEVADHIDNDYTNDNPDNLQILSRPENTSKGHSEGNCQHPPLHEGEKQWKSILDPDKVREMRKLRSEGKSVSEIGSKFGMKPISVYDVLSGKTWKHVK